MIKQNDIIIRAIEPNDLNFIFDTENNHDYWSLSDTMTPFSKNILQKFVDYGTDLYADKQVRFIVDQNNTQIGIIDLFDFDPIHSRAGIGIIINNEYQGKGLAYETLKTFLHYCFCTLQLKNIYCNILESNTSSIKLFEKLNFEKIGVKKKWRKINNIWQDELFYQKLNPLNEVKHEN